MSTDRTTWQRLGRIPTADVAISPDDSSIVVITTEDGPQISRDSGRSFELIADAPLLMLVDWPRPAEFVGIAPDGVVYVSADGGGSWEQRGDIGERTHALTVAPDGSVYAATEHASFIRPTVGAASRSCTRCTDLGQPKGERPVGVHLDSGAELGADAVKGAAEPRAVCG